MGTRSSKNATVQSADGTRIPRSITEIDLTRSDFTSAEMCALFALEDTEDGHHVNGMIAQKEETPRTNRRKSSQQKDREWLELLMRIAREMESRDKFVIVVSLTGRLDRYIAKAEKLLAGSKLAADERVQIEELLAKFIAQREVLLGKQETLQAGGRVSSRRMEDAVDTVERRVGRFNTFVANRAKANFDTSAPPTFEAPNGMQIPHRHAPVDLPGDLQQMFMRRRRGDVDGRNFVSQHGDMHHEEAVA